MIATDVEPQQRGIARLDFLNDPPPAATRGAILITNPPFGGSGLLDPFLNRLMALLDSGHLAPVVLLQRADSGGTINRAATFNRAVAEWTAREYLHHVEQGLGPAVWGIVLAVAVDDLNYARLGRRCRCDPKTAKRCAIEAIKALATV